MCFRELEVMRYCRNETKEKDERKNSVLDPDSDPDRVGVVLFCRIRIGINS
jgi:hypothetical protein